MTQLNYKMIEEELNLDAQMILHLIEVDYARYMSPEVRKRLLDLISRNDVVKVNKGPSPFNDNTLAHGGRTLNDNTIHFYPDVRNYSSTAEAIAKCKAILLHEIFHFFIQPDNISLSHKRDQKMAEYYTEGLVEKMSRKFYQDHRNLLTFEEANYGFNINFVNEIQEDIGGDSLKVIFSTRDYLYKIGKYWDPYIQTRKREKLLRDLVDTMSQYFPKNVREKLTARYKTAILREGYTRRTKEIILPKLQEEADKYRKGDIDFE